MRDYNIAEHRAAALERKVQEAMEQIDLAMQDTAADQGDEAAEAGWHDIVHGVADECPPAVRSEVLRRNFGLPEAASAPKCREGCGEPALPNEGGRCGFCAGLGYVDEAGTEWPYLATS